MAVIISRIGKKDGQKKKWKNNKAKKQLGKKKKKIKAKKTSKKAAVVDKTSEYSLLSALANVFLAALVGQFWRGDGEKAKRDLHLLFSKSGLSAIAIVGSNDGEEKRCLGVSEIKLYGTPLTL